MNLKNIPLIDLLHALQLVSKFTADRDIVPALTYLYFKGNSIRAYSGISGANVHTPWNFGEGFAVAGARLMNVMTKLNDRGAKEVNLSIEALGKPLVIKSGNSKTSHDTLPKEALADFVFRDPPTNDTVKVSLEFWSDVARVELSVCEDGAKPGLCGIYWASSGKIMSADGSRLSIMRPDKKSTPPRFWAAPGEGILMPSHLLNRLASERHRVKEIQVEGDNLLWFHLDNASVWGQLLESQFPAARSESIVSEVKKKMSEGQSSRVVFDNKTRQEILSGLELILPFSDEIGLNAVTSRILPEAIEFAAGAGNTNAKDSAKVEVTGPGGEFTVNGKFLKDIISQVQTTRFYYSGMSPLYFLSDDKQMEHVLLPLSGQPNAQSAPDSEESF